MLTGTSKVQPLWMSVWNNVDFYKKKLMSAPLSKVSVMDSKTLTIHLSLILPGSIKDLSIMMKNSKTLKEKDARPISSSFSILWNINNL